MKTILGLCLVLTIAGTLNSVEIPLDALAPSRIGYVDLQRVFDTFPEKSFAEGDLLREIEKRKRELSRRQTQINVLNQQISLDEAALADSRKGQVVVVPVNTVPEPVAAAPAPTAVSTSTVKGSTTTAVEAYPTEDPLAGLPGHEGALLGAEKQASDSNLPGMQDRSKKTILDTLAAENKAVALTPEAQTALAQRVETNKRALDRAMVEFKTFRGNALADMKVLQSQKTYGVMSKIYAVLQNLAREENVMVVMDKAYVLYGEDAVDLSEKLIERLQGEPQG